MFSERFATNWCFVQRDSLQAWLKLQLKCILSTCVVLEDHWNSVRGKRDQTCELFSWKNTQVEKAVFKVWGKKWRWKWNRESDSWAELHLEPMKIGHFWKEKGHCSHSPESGELQQQSAVEYALAPPTISPLPKMQNVSHFAFVSKTTLSATELLGHIALFGPRDSFVVVEILSTFGLQV